MRINSCNMVKTGLIRLDNSGQRRNKHWRRQVLLINNQRNLLSFPADGLLLLSTGVKQCLQLFHGRADKRLGVRANVMKHAALTRKRTAPP